MSKISTALKKLFCDVFINRLNFSCRVRPKIKNPSVGSIQKIQEFSEEELIRELGARFDNFVFAAEKECDQSGDDAAVKQRVRPVRYYIGDRMICSGLAMSVSQMALEDHWGIKEHNIVY